MALKTAAKLVRPFDTQIIMPVSSDKIREEPVVLRDEGRESETYVTVTEAEARPGTDRPAYRDFQPIRIRSKP